MTPAEDLRLGNEVEEIGRTIKDVNAGASHVVGEMIIAQALYEIAKQLAILAQSMTALVEDIKKGR